MYISYILFILYFFIFSFSFQNEGFKNVKNDDYIIKFFSFLMILILTFISGFRFDVGKDFLTYENMYNDSSFYANYFVEPFWNYLSLVLHKIGVSSVGWFLLTSFVINFLIITTIRKYSENFFISILFYICIPHLFLESFNIVRQFCAIAVIFYFSHYFFERKYLKFILVIIFASFLHKSAILTIPIFLISILRIPNFLLIIFIVGSFLLRNKFFKYVINIVSFSNIYSGYVDKLIPSESNTGLYAFIILFINLFIIFFFYKENNIYIIKLKNLTIFSFCIYLLFYTFQAGMRIGFYIMPYILFLIPIITKKMKKNAAFFSIAILFSLFSLFSIKTGFSSYFNFRF